MKREEYNACMSAGMRGKKLSKEDRKKEFCVNAKLCSGKVKDRAEAERICGQPKLPKWAQQEVTVEELSCPLRMTRVADNIDVINLKVRSGEADEVLGAGAQVLEDLIHCRAETGVVPLAEEALKDLKDLSKRHYLKGEGKDLEGKLNIIKELL